MLKIRLTRRGKRNKAFYRIVVAEHTAPIKGRFLEALGFLNPHSKEKDIKAERVKFWLEKGAQCSDTVHNLFVKEGIISAPKRAIKIKKKKEEKPEEEKAEKEEKPKAEKEEAASANNEAKPEEKAEKKEESTKSPEVKEEKNEKEGAKDEKKDDKKAEKE